MLIYAKGAGVTHDHAEALNGFKKPLIRAIHKRGPSLK